jgi:hypothetical protein
MIMSKRHYGSLLITAGMLLVTILSAQPALGQLVTGSIGGVITDASGGAVPEVEVTVVNIATNLSRTVTTANDGGYLLPNLPPGFYTVTVKHAGFTTSTRGNVEVVLSSGTTVNFQLAVGEVTQSVTVSAQPSAISTTSPDRGVAITTNTILALPLEVSPGSGGYTGEARAIDGFIFLSPGVTGDAFSTKINGAPSFSHEVIYDGMPYLSGDHPGEIGSTRPPFESMDEFKMDVNGYSAEYGRGIAAEVFHMTSGTNVLHGDGFEFLKNNALDARGFFPSSVPVLRQNEFGFAVGGPVYIPKVYDGRNKTFWHVAWTRFLQRVGTQNALLTVPTAKMVTGDFTEWPQPIYDPTTNPRQQFSCNGVLNVICPDRISAITKLYLPLVPTGTLPGVTNNLLVGVPAGSPLSEDEIVIKIDHSFGSKYHLYGSYMRTLYQSVYAQVVPGPLGKTSSNLKSWPRQPRIALDQNLTPNIMNTISAGYNRWWVVQAVPANSLVSSPLAPTGVPFPAFAMTGYNTLGAGGSTVITLPLASAVLDTLNWVHGRHQMKIGTDLRWLNETKDANNAYPGTYSFSNTETSNPASPSFSSMGNAFASLLLGDVDTLSRTTLAGRRGIHTAYRAFYFQDNFRLRPKLTLNLGVRYDIPVPATEKYNRFSTFDPNVANPGAGGLPGALVFLGNYAGACVSQAGPSLCRSGSLSNTRYNEVQPRLGFAYAYNDRTVVRAGYGINYLSSRALAMMDGNIVSSFLSGFWANQYIPNPYAGASPVFQWDTGLPAVPPVVQTLSGANGSSIDYWEAGAGAASYLQNWSLTVERRLPGDVALETSYVGTKGSRLPAQMYNVNQLNAKYLPLGSVLGDDINSPEAAAAGIKPPYAGFTGTVGQALRPYPQYTGISDNLQGTGSSTYHAFQARLQKYYAQGVSFLVGYTASKTLDNTDYSFGSFNATPLDTANRKLEKSIDSIDQPQVFVASGTYELPIGPGKHFVNMKGPVGKVLGGWQMTWILSYASGTPLGIRGGPDPGLYGGGNRPNVVSGADPLAFHGGKFDPAVDLYLNRAAFSSPAPYTIGNAPRYSSNIRGFGNKNESMGFLKQTNITEAVYIQFRAEFFNIFNRTVFGGPDTNINDVSYGVVSGQVNMPRLIQFGLKLYF